MITTENTIIYNTNNQPIQTDNIIEEEQTNNINSKFTEEEIKEIKNTLKEKYRLEENSLIDIFNNNKQILTYLFLQKGNYRQNQQQNIFITCRQTYLTSEIYNILIKNKNNNNETFKIERKHIHDIVIEKTQNLMKNNFNIDSKVSIGLQIVSEYEKTYQMCFSNELQIAREIDKFLSKDIFLSFVFCNTNTKLNNIENIDDNIIKELNKQINDTFLSEEINNDFAKMSLFNYIYCQRASQIIIDNTEELKKYVSAHLYCYKYFCIKLNSTDNNISVENITYIANKYVGNIVYKFLQNTYQKGKDNKAIENVINSFINDNFKKQISKTEVKKDITNKHNYITISGGIICLIVVCYFIFKKILINRNKMYF